MNMAGATVRIGKEIGHRPGSRGEALAKQIASGDMPYLDYEDWLRIVADSGIEQGTAANILNQGTRNRLYATPTIQEGIRRSQYRYDIAPYLAQLERAFPGKDVQGRCVLRGQMDDLARSRGYESWENLQQLHGSEMLSRARGIANPGHDLREVLRCLLYTGRGRIGSYRPYCEADRRVDDAPKRQSSRKGRCREGHPQD